MADKKTVKKNAKNKGDSNMGASEILSIVGGGLSLAMSLAERVSVLRSSKDKDEYIATMDEKIDHIGAATVELDEKLTLMREELDATRKEVEMLKKILLAMGIALGVAIVAIIVSFVI